MRAFKIGFWSLLTLGIIVSCVFFATQNSDPMTVTILGHTTEVQPKWKVLLVAAAIGAILSTIFFIIELVVLESKNISLRRINKRLVRALEKSRKGEAIDPHLLSLTEPSARVAAEDDDDV